MKIHEILDENKVLIGTVRYLGPRNWHLRHDYGNYSEYGFYTKADAIQSLLSYHTGFIDRYNREFKRVLDILVKYNSYDS